MNVTIKDYQGDIQNVLFPGDKVKLDGNKIIAIGNRENVLSRMVSDNTKNNSLAKKQIVATNIDLALIVVSPITPELHPKFIDRYMILLNKLNIPFALVLNKCDLEDERTKEILKVYQNLGIEIVKTSTINNAGINELENVIKDKQVVLIGQSGVGKSSLTNALCNAGTRVSHIGDKTKRGRHTTTSSENHYIDNKTRIIDTPGIRSISLANFNTTEIMEHFKEFNIYKDKCKYNNCNHDEENTEDCAVKQAVNNNQLLKSRYESYLKLLEQIKK